MCEQDLYQPDPIRNAYIAMKTKVTSTLTSYTRMDRLNTDDCVRTFVANNLKQVLNFKVSSNKTKYN